MSLQLYQVDSKSYLLDFKSLSPHIDDVIKDTTLSSRPSANGSASLNSSLSESMARTVYHESESSLRQRNSGKSVTDMFNQLTLQPAPSVHVYY